MRKSPLDTPNAPFSASSPADKDDVDLAARELETARDGLLRRLWGTEVRVTGSVELAHRCSVVERLQLSGPAGTPPSVIVKHALPEHVALGALSETNAYFVEERIAHVFLRELGAEAGVKAKLLAEADPGVLLIEDLGPEPEVGFKPYTFLVPRLASAFARLHSRTHGHEDRYKHLREAAGLPPEDRDNRILSARVDRYHARAGLAYLLRVSRDIGIDASGVEEDAENAFRFNDAPGPFRCLTHDDAAHHRQLFDHDDEVLLLDFEHAHYTNALFDLCRLMLGKYEKSTDTGQLIWLNAEFPPAFLQAYRLCFESETGKSFPIDLWHEVVGAAFLQSVLSQIGYLDLLPARKILQGTVRQNANGLLYAYGKLIGDWAPATAMRSFIPRFLRLPNLEWVSEAAVTAAQRPQPLDQGVAQR